MRRALLPIVFLLSLSLLLPSAARADPVTEVVTPSTQSLTDFTQSGGTFAACAANIDGTTCDYLEGDDGAGATGTAILMAARDVGPNTWTASGCAEGTEFACVADFPSDSDTTYITSSAPSPRSVYTWTVCVVPLCSYTITSVQVFGNARFVAGPGTDPSVILTANGPDCSVTTGALPLTTSYVNYSSAGACNPWTTAELAATNFEAFDNNLGAHDAIRVTNIGLLVGWLAPNYRGTVQYDFINVHHGGNSVSMLTIRMAVASGESWVCDIFDWPANAYTAGILTFSSTSQTTQTYAMLNSQHVSATGEARFRCIDQNQAADETQDTIAIDSAFISTTWDDGQLIGGGDLGELLTLRCTPHLLSMDCTLTLINIPQGISLQQTDWYIDHRYAGNGTAVSLFRQSFRADHGHFPLGTANVTVVAHLSNGQSGVVSTPLAINYLWLLLIPGAIAACIAAAWHVRSRSAKRRSHVRS